MSDIIVNSNRKVILRFGLPQVIENRLGHTGIELSRAKTIPSPHNGWVLFERSKAFTHRLTDRRPDILIKRFSNCARLLCSVQNGNCRHRRRKSPYKIPGTERPEKPHLYHADLFTLAGKVGDNLLHGFGSRSHEYSNPFRIGCPYIVKEFVLSPRKFRKPVHVLLYYLGRLLIVAIDRFPCCKKNVRIL